MRTLGRTPVLRRAVHHASRTIKRLFGELDLSLAFSREVFGPAPGTASTGPLDGRSSSNDQADSGSPEAAPGTPDEKQSLWKDAWRKAEEREEDECPICMCSMMPVSANNNNNNSKNNTEQEGAQGREILGANQEIRSTLSTEKEATAELSPAGRDRTTSAEAVEVEEGQDRGAEGEGRGVASRRRLQMAGDDGGGATNATEERRRRGGNRRRRQEEVGDQRKRLLLSCSHVFHKAVSPRGGSSIREGPKDVCVFFWHYHYYWCAM